MRRHLLQLGALLALLALPSTGRGAEIERARNSPCTGIYTGAARGVFWCRVSVVHDVKANRSTLLVETEEDIQLNGDALAITPGSFSWIGAPVVGVIRSGDVAVAGGVSTLRTGVPPTEVDYGATRATPKIAPDQGRLTLELVRAEPGPKQGTTQVFLVHGTFSAHLLPLPGSQGVGDVQVTVRF